MRILSLFFLVVSLISIAIVVSGVAGDFWILPTNNETNPANASAPNIVYTTNAHPVYHNSSVRTLVLKNPVGHWFVSCVGCNPPESTCTGAHQVVSAQAAANNCLYATNAAPFDTASNTAKCRGNVVVDGVVVKRSPEFNGAACVGLFKASSPRANHWLVGLDGSKGVQDSLDNSELEQLVCGFGMLVVDGKAQYSSATEIAPRVGWGVDAKGSLVSVVADGSEVIKTGLTLNETADLLVRAGARYALNMDGGGSATVWFERKVTNCPTCIDIPKCCERAVETIQCIR